MITKYAVIVISDFLKCFFPESFVYRNYNTSGGEVVFLSAHVLIITEYLLKHEHALCFKHLCMAAKSFES